MNFEEYVTFGIFVVGMAIITFVLWKVGTWREK